MRCPCAQQTPKKTPRRTKRMITDYDDFCLRGYVLNDDMNQASARTTASTGGRCLRVATANCLLWDRSVIATAGIWKRRCSIFCSNIEKGSHNAGAMSVQAPTTPKERDVPFLLFTLFSEEAPFTGLPPAAGAPRLSPAPRHPVGRSACPTRHRRRPGADRMCQAEDLPAAQTETGYRPAHRQTSGLS